MTPEITDDAHVTRNGDLESALFLGSRSKSHDAVYGSNLLDSCEFHIVNHICESYDS